MKIRRIRLRNLHSIQEEVDIDFMASPLADTGLFAITGDTGAGKTTILDAITLALYGKICRNSQEHEVLSHGASEGFAHCEFEAGSRRFIAKWSVSRRKSRTGLYKTDRHRMIAEWDEKTGEYTTQAERRIREIDAFVEEVTGLDFDRFTRSVMLAQGDFAAFLKAAPKERSELLERITGTEVYSQLSIAALERYRIEQQLLEDMRKKYDSFHLFTKEEIKERKATLQQQEKENALTKQALEENRKMLLWLQRSDSLRSRLEVLKETALGIAAEKKQLQPSMDMLALHKKSLPLQPTLLRLDDHEKEAKVLQDEIAQLGQGRAQLAEQQKSAADEFVHWKNLLEELKAGQADAMRLFEEVGKLDQQKADKEAHWNKMNNEAHALSVLQQENEARCTKLENESKEAGKAIETIERWLEENKVLEQLPADLPAIRIKRDQLREILLEQKLVKDELQSLGKKLENAHRTEQELQADLTREKKLLEVWQEEFKQVAEEEFQINRHDLLEKMNREIDDLSKQQHNFQQLGRLSDAYSQSLTELADLEEELDNLRNEELAITKSLLSVTEEAEERETQLKFKQENYRLHQRMANYEQDRANLQPGDPCPLCLSVHHPFREHGTPIYVDEAREEMERAEQSFQHCQKKRNELLKRHFATAARIQQIDSGGNGEIGKVYNRLLDYERMMAELIPGLSEEDFSKSHGEWLLKRLGSFDTYLSQRKNTREILVQLNRDMGMGEEKIRQLENKARELYFEIQHTGNSKKDKERNLAELDKKFTQVSQDLDGLVKKYGYRFTIELANGMFSELEARGKEFPDKKESLAEWGRKRLEIDQERHHLLNAVTDLQTKRISIQLEAEQLKNTLAALKDRRLQLFGTKDPQTEREKLLEELNRVEKAVEETRSTFNKINADLALAQQSLENKENQLAKNQMAVEELRNALNKGLKKADFIDEAALRSAILAEETVHDIETKAAAIHQQELETSLGIRETDQELNALLQQNLTTRQLAEIEAEIGALEKNMQEVQQQIGALQQQLRDNELRQKEAGELLKKTEEQRTIFNRWAALYDLIGSSDGKKFRIFAQGLTLQKLVQMANTHLTNLFGRYVIVKRPGEDLVLDIVDTYQADNVRSMNTLSGGESFLVSLALALGLSDLAGRNANIRSLFIDEGFGTLDEQTLDMAITTLENLQAHGKTIGIISHVKELKERISTQVKVVKKGGGSSTVEILG